MSGTSAVLYWLSFALVLSFILFEVLDIDLTFFPTVLDPGAGQVLSPESGSDIKRTVLVAAPVFLPAPTHAGLFRCTPPTSDSRRMPAFHFFGVANDSAYLIALPRAALGGDSLPS